MLDVVGKHFRQKNKKVDQMTVEDMETWMLHFDKWRSNVGKKKKIGHVDARNDLDNVSQGIPAVC